MREVMWTNMRTGAQIAKSSDLGIPTMIGREFASMPQVQAGWGKTTEEERVP